MDLQLQKYNHFIHFYLPATKKNIPPLKGSTLLLVSIGNEMKMSKMASKSSSKKITSALGWDFMEKIYLVLSDFRKRNWRKKDYSLNFSQKLSKLQMISSWIVKLTKFPSI